MDRFAAFNLGLSRPIVVSLIIGLLFGHVESCLLIGILSEMIGIVDVPVGTRIPKDDSFIAYAASLLSVLDVLDGLTTYSLGFLLVLVAMVPVTLSCGICRKINKKDLMKHKKSSKGIRSDSLIIRGLTVAFIRGLLVYNIAFMLIYFVMSFLSNVLPIEHNLSSFVGLIVMFLAGFLIRFLSGSTIIKYSLFACGFVLGWVYL